MSIITLPAALRLGAGGGMGQARFDMLTQSDSSGSQQARLLAPPRWTLRLVQPDNLTLDAAGAWTALAVRMRGRVNVLAAWDPARPAPQGTARGTLTTAGSTAAGATSAVLAGAVNANLLLGPGFELDSNADGVADGWVAYNAGVTGPAYSRTAGSGSLGPASPFEQRCFASSLGPSSSSQLGVKSSLVPVFGNQPYSFSVDLFASHSTLNVALFIVWYDAVGVGLSSSSSVGIGPMVRERRSITATAHALATQAACFVWAEGAGSTLTSAQLYLDNAQFEAAPAATPAIARPTLLAGDWLQIGAGLGTSHYCMVTDAATADDAGNIAISFEPPTRMVFSVATAVAWNKPLAYYRQQNESTTWGLANGGRSGTLVTGLSLDLMEVWS